MWTESVISYLVIKEKGYLVLSDTVLLKNDTSKTPRQSNLELFRIISMLLIVAHHYVVNSGLTAADGPIVADMLSARSLFLITFGAWGKVGINCFMFITGYFMCKSKLTSRKYVKLLGEVMFYKIVLYFVFLALGVIAFSPKDFVLKMLPVDSVSDMFTSSFLIFYLLIPFLNILINHLTELQHIKLIILCCFTYVVLGCIPVITVVMNYVTWFTVLYFISSYIRLYPKKIFNKTCLWGILSIASVAISVVSIIVLAYIGNKRGAVLSYWFLYDSNKILAVIVAFSAFMFFKNVRIPYSKFINTVAASCFGVLLLHASSVTREWLWYDVVDSIGAYSSKYMYIYAIGTVLAIFVVCTVIDILRIRFIETPFMKLWDKLYPGILKRYKSAELKFCKIFGINS